jgi:hypothetical protein
MQGLNGNFAKHVEGQDVFLARPNCILRRHSDFSSLIRRPANPGDAMTMDAARQMKF